MTTIRVERRDRWTTVARTTVNDTSLSFRARGVLVWLLDKPDGWRVRSEAIALAGTEGRDAIRAALRELEAAGYLTRSVCRDGRGRIRSTAVVRETPGHTGDGKPALVDRPPVDQAAFQRLTPRTQSASQSTESSTGCGQREFRYYDDEPLTPEQIAAKYGCEA